MFAKKFDLPVDNSYYPCYYKYELNMNFEGKRIGFFADSFLLSATAVEVVSYCCFVLHL